MYFQRIDDKLKLPYIRNSYNSIATQISGAWKI